MLTIVKKNDSYDAITYQLENEDNSTVDLTGASVNFVMGKKNKLITNAKATVTSATSGIVSYQLTPLDTLVSGTFLAEFVVTFANGTTKTYPSNGYITVDVEQNLDTSQANVVVDMIAEKQGDFTSKLNSILLQAGNINMSAMNEYSWTATEGQLIFIFPSSVNYTPSTKWFQVSVGNVPVDNTLVNRSYDNQFALNIDSSNIKAGMTVRAMWVEPITPVVPNSYKIIPQQDLPPVDAGEGDLWFDTSDNTYQGTIFDTLNSQLAESASKQVGVLHIEQYINLVPNRNVTTDTTQWDWTAAWNQAITDLQNVSGGFRTLFLGGRNYNISTSTTVTFPLSLQGIYNARKALSDNGGSKLVDTSTGSTPFITYDGAHAPANRIWGGLNINDIHIDGKNAAHDCISMINTAWEMRIDSLYIENFQGSALITDTVYDSVITALTIYKCGGMTDLNGNIRYALQLDSSVSDCSNAIHFFGLHIENCRYMTKLVKARHIQFIGSKWECWEPSTVTPDLTNPFIWIDTISLEITFSSCMFVTNSALKWVSSGYATNITQTPYFIDVMGSTTVDVGAMATIFDSCQFTNPPGLTGGGSKVMRSGSGCFKVNNCQFDYLTGGDYGIYLKSDSHITNCKIGVQATTDGKVLGIRLDRSNALGNTIRVYNPTFVAVTQDTAILTVTGIIGDNRFYGFTNKVVGDSGTTDSIFRRRKNIIKVSEALFKSLHGLTTIDYTNVTLDMTKFETGHIVFEFDNSFTLKRIIGGFDCDEVIIHNNKTGTITLAFNVGDVANSKLVLSKNVNAVLNPEEMLALKFAGWQWMETGRRSIT